MHRSERDPARHHSFWHKGLTRVAVAASAVLLVVFGTAGPAAAAADYTQSVTQLNATQAQISFTPTTPARYVDVHYLSPSSGQQNFRMTNTAGTWQRTVSSLPSGFVLEYWFTYEKGGPQFDTPHFFYTHGSTTSPVATPTFSPPGGTYTTAQSVTIATTTAGASIR
ncbi:chitobiase/beta-hexosaminidase C-terminal domain-containing protein, partial [Dactylosporangium sp. NPDC049525]|uniref:chitobiase/beta-hexosaminidase C-terminal domain-containing protein n=1 Tax=Dactylosporangium sp. NPDC049525 TaxID=3154730 RepID=UPI003442047A